MNREEAIVMWVIPALENTWNEKKCNEILDALEQEPCDDAISREAVLDLCDSKDEEYKVRHFREDVECLPSVHPECTEDYCPAAFKPVECEDCISRQATVERLCKVADFMNEKREGLGSPYIMAALFIQDNKDEFPSVTPAEKVGRWIKDESSSIAYRCTVCNTLQHWSVIQQGRYHFCPNCGAKMQEVEE